MIKYYEMEVFAIFEPWISKDKTGTMINKLEFPKDQAKDASGFARGIWILWEVRRVSTKIMTTNEHVITASTASAVVRTGFLRCT